MQHSDNASLKENIKIGQQIEDSRIRFKKEKKERERRI